MGLGLYLIKVGQTLKDHEGGLVPGSGVSIVIKTRTSGLIRNR